jgi:hypothetical protein
MKALESKIQNCKSKYRQFLEKQSSYESSKSKASFWKYS